MRRSRTVSVFRLLNPSAIGLIFVFAATAYAAVNVVAFERLDERLAKGDLISSGDAARSIKGTLERLGSWKNTPGVATRAQSLTLDVILAETPGDTAAIGNALADLAKASPTSVNAWQALVVFHEAHRAPAESVFAAFRMSALTGSHEAYFMMQRAIFGLEHWSELPELDRQTVIRDVLKTVLIWEFGRGKRYRAILAAKPEAERDDIRTALTASGLATQEALQVLGI